jgi:hypothetical protein
MRGKIQAYSLIIALNCCFSIVSASDHQWAGPTYFASATCSEFKWVDDLKFTDDTVNLLENGFYALGGEKSRYLSWKNGTADEFLTWTNQIPSDKNAVLIFYFSTHQKPKGRIKFTSGPDLEAPSFITKVNLFAEKFRRVLLIYDCCRASELEKHGEFAANVTRLYSASEGEEAVDLDFDKGPYGQSEFIEKERTWIESCSNLKLRGLTFLITLGLKASHRLSQESSKEIDIQILIKQMTTAREEYDEDVRHGKLQHFKLIPEDANLALFKKTASTSP